MLNLKTREAGAGPGAKRRREEIEKTGGTDKPSADYRS